MGIAGHQYPRGNQEEGIKGIKDRHGKGNQAGIKDSHISSFSYKNREFFP
jgi:hypothetical protein